MYCPYAANEEPFCAGALAAPHVGPNANCLRHGAAPSLPISYTEAIDGGLIGPSAGSCGTAAYRAAQVIVSDIATDPLWADYRDLALAHGLRACWSTPILSSAGKVLGTFATYYRQPRSPSPQEQNVIERITHLASIAVEREQAEEALRQAQADLAHVNRVTTMGELTASIAHEISQPIAARIQLQQVILNLIINAIEAMSGLIPADLVVSSGKDGSDSVRVSVLDSGEGLMEGTLDRLFEAFYTTKPNGMGMGLAVSRSIISDHGGRLWATPNAPGGAVFQFTLPRNGDSPSREA